MLPFTWTPPFGSPALVLYCALSADLAFVSQVCLLAAFLSHILNAGIAFLENLPWLPNPLLSPLKRILSEDLLTSMSLVSSHLPALADSHLLCFLPLRAISFRQFCNSFYFLCLAVCHEDIWDILRKLHDHLLSKTVYIMSGPTKSGLRQYPNLDNTRIPYQFAIVLKLSLFNSTSGALLGKDIMQYPLPKLAKDVFHGVKDALFFCKSADSFWTIEQFLELNKASRTIFLLASRRSPSVSSGHSLIALLSIYLSACKYAVLALCNSDCLAFLQVSQSAIVESLIPALHSGRYFFF